MPTKVYTGSTFSEAQPKYWSESSWLVPKFVKVWTGAAWQNVFVRFTGAVSPTTLTGSTSFTGAAWIGQTASSATATPEGGTGTVTYSWRRVSGDNTITAMSGTSQSTKFQYNSASIGSGQADFVCDVEDSAGNTATTDAVTVEFS